MSDSHPHSTAPTTASEAQQQRTAMTWSLGVAVLMLVGKGAAYALTGSTAILSDALESVVHLAATVVAGFSLWYAQQPPDRSHPYGHGKIAYVSAGLEGALILVAAVVIVWTAVDDLVNGSNVQSLGWGLAITAALGGVNLVLGLGLIRVGRRTNALVLVSNGRHVLTDMWTSIGVIVGVGLVVVTGIEWLDPVVALVLGLNIVWTGVGLLRSAYGGLMESVEAAEADALLGVLDAAISEGLIDGYHRARHRRVNDQVWLEQHLLMPDDLRLDEAHARATEVESRQTALFPQARVQITSHLEPASHEHPEAGAHDSVAEVA